MKKRKVKVGERRKENELCEHATCQIAGYTLSYFLKEMLITRNFCLSKRINKEFKKFFRGRTVC